jgi:Family of unknown function (DUF5908)
MPVEIRELVIRAVVDARQATDASEVAAETDREALIQACVEETLRILRRKKER